MMTPYVAARGCAPLVLDGQERGVPRLARGRCHGQADRDGSTSGEADPGAGAGDVRQAHRRTAWSRYVRWSSRPVTVAARAACRVNSVACVMLTTVARVNTGARSGVRLGLEPCPTSDQQHERGNADRAQLQPVLKALDEGDSLHAAHRDVAAHDHAEGRRADPVRRAEHPLQRDARALHLRQQVEPADDEHERGRRLAQAARPQAADGEIGDGVRAEPPQRRRHQQQQDQVAGGVADRVPQCAEALRHDQPGDAEEGGGRQVLTRDGGGVERRRTPHGRRP